MIIPANAIIILRTIKFICISIGWIIKNICYSELYRLKPDSINLPAQGKYMKTMKLFMNEISKIFPVQRPPVTFFFNSLFFYNFMVTIHITPNYIHELRIRLFSSSPTLLTGVIIFLEQAIFHASFQKSFHNNTSFVWRNFLIQVNINNFVTKSKCI